MVIRKAISAVNENANENNSGERNASGSLYRADRIPFLKHHGAGWRKANLIAALSCLTAKNVDIRDIDTVNNTVMVEISDSGNERRKEMIEIITNLLTKLCYTGTRISAASTDSENIFVLFAEPC